MIPSFRLGAIAKTFETSGPPLVGAFDPYTANLWGVYSLEVEVGAYTGPLIRVRRSSDNAELDIGHASGSVALDVTGLTAWAGAGSAFVKTVYNQYGAGSNLTTAANGNEPLIVSSGTYLGEITHDGVDDYFTTTTNPQHSAMTLYSRSHLAVNTPYQYMVACNTLVGGSDAAHGAVQWDYNPATSAHRNVIATSGYANLVLNQCVFSPLTERAYAIVWDFTQSSNVDRVSIYFNGTVATPSISPAGTVSMTAVLNDSPIYIGAGTNAVAPGTLKWKKMIFYDAGHNAATVATISAVV